MFPRTKNGFSLNKQNLSVKFHVKYLTMSLSTTLPPDDDLRHNGGNYVYF